MNDFDVQDEDISSAVTFINNKGKKRQKSKAKSKTKKNSSNTKIKSQAKINESINSNHQNIEYEDNVTQMIDSNPNFYQTDEFEDLTIEELFELMVCKVGDYFQNVLDDMIDNLCYELLCILDQETNIDEMVNSFRQKINEELKTYFDQLNTEKHSNLDIDSHDYSEYIFEPYYEEFFETFLNSHDYCQEIPNIHSNSVKRLLTKVASTTRETKRKLEKCYHDLSYQLSDLDALQNSIKHYQICQDQSIHHLNELKEQEYKYEYLINLYQMQIETISNQSNYMTNSHQIKDKPEEITRDDIRINTEILSKKIEESFRIKTTKNDLKNTKKKLLKYKTNGNEILHELTVVNEMMNGISRAHFYSNIDFNVMPASVKIAPMSVQLKSFDRSSISDFKSKFHEIYLETEKSLEESRYFLDTIKEDITMFSQLV